MAEASEDMRRLAVERTKEEAEERRMSDTSGAVFGRTDSVRSTKQQSADTQEYESCQQNDVNESDQWDDMDVDMHEKHEGFIPRDVSNSADWREPKVMCDWQCRKKSFKYYDIARASELL